MEIETLIKDIKEISLRHRIPFEEKAGLGIDLEAVAGRIEKAGVAVQLEIREKALIGRVGELFIGDNEKQCIITLLEHGSLHSAIMLLLTVKV